MHSINVLLILLGTTLAAGSPADVTGFARKWSTFKANHQRKYANDREETRRFAVYLSNAKSVLRQNLLYAVGKSSFQMELNEFSDWTPQEAYTRLAGLSKGPYQNRAPNATMNRSTSDLPKAVDWRDQNAVTAVKHQGQCGSCWAFSAVAAMESHLYLNTGRLTSLSEQQLIDCTHYQRSRYANSGCNGGWMQSSYVYVYENNGIGTASGYPYEAQLGHCRSDAVGTAGGRLRGYSSIEQTEAALQRAVASKGPISVAINVGSSFFQYKTGVHYDRKCQGQSLHAVLVVGYGTDERSGMDYWLVKNSWGSAWGEEGYVRMARNHNNNCGISNFASYPLMV